MGDENQSQTERDKGQGLFEATQWSLVCRAREKSETALSALCERYRQPLLVWLRLRGLSPHDSEDMLQGFFHHLFQRDFLSNVRREKGTFRSFLLQSLKNFWSDQREKARAQKRGGGAAVASLDEVSEDGRAVYNAASGEPWPDREFDRAWARMLLANSLAELEQECSRAGHAKLFASLEPTIASDATAQSYRDIGNRLGMTEAAVKTAAHRIRSRWKALIKQEVLQTVTNQDDWQREVRYLIGLFGE